MEGFAVLRACELAGVPALELRAVVNEIAEPDRALWRFDDGLALLARRRAAAARGARCLTCRPPLPPAERTVGQLIAETIRALRRQLLARRCRSACRSPCSTSSTSAAAARSASRSSSLCAPFLAFAFAYACTLAGKVRPGARTLAVATAIGTRGAAARLARVHVVRARRGRLPVLRGPVRSGRRAGGHRVPGVAAARGRSSAAPTGCMRSARSPRSSSSSSSRGRCSCRCCSGQADDDDPRRGLPRRRRARAADAARDGDALLRPGRPGRHRPQAPPARRRRRDRALTGTDAADRAPSLVSDDAAHGPAIAGSR